MNSEQAKRIPLPEILAALGCEPITETPKKAKYKSPFRNERTASFHVNKEDNVWYDHGEGIGGNVLAFVSHYLQCTSSDHQITDCLRWLENMTFEPLLVKEKKQPTKESGWGLKSAETLDDYALTRYLEKRGITVGFAKRHLQQVYVEHRELKFGIYALGFKNEDGGYELRNSFFKSSTTPKTITFIRGNIAKPASIQIFEGFMDYLSYLTLKKGVHESDVIVLNSVSHTRQAMGYIRNYGYANAFTWLDNDKGGNKAAEEFAAFFKNEIGLTHKNMNFVYKQHKDLNAWHMHRLGLTLYP